MEDGETGELDGYYAQSIVTVPADAATGVSVIEFTNPAYDVNPEDGYMDFTFVVNPLAPDESMTTVDVQVKAATNGDHSVGDINVSDAQANANSYPTGINYTTVLDASKAALKTDINIVESYGDSMVTSIGGVSNNYDTNEGWQYRVYRGGEANPLCEDVGAGVFNIKNGDTIVWAYGSYDDPSIFD